MVKSFWTSHLQIMNRLEPLQFRMEQVDQKVHQKVYHKVVSSNTSHLEAYADFSRLLMKGIFYPYVVWPFDKKLISKLIMPVRTTIR